MVDGMVPTRPLLDMVLPLSNWSMDNQRSIVIKPIKTAELRAVHLSDEA